MFLAQGGKLIRGTVQHISQIVEGGTDAFDSRQFSVAKQPDAIIVCTGIGSRSLGGIEDSDVFPQRGQTVIIRAPWIKEGRTISDANDTSWTYIIPRRSGDVRLLIFLCSSVK
jgi:glycine/D-amino acid oxidase-like deaminating enzyme